MYHGQLTVPGWKEFVWYSEEFFSFVIPVLSKWTVLSLLSTSSQKRSVYKVALLQSNWNISSHHRVRVITTVLVTCHILSVSVTLMYLSVFLFRSVLFRLDKCFPNFFLRKYCSNPHLFVLLYAKLCPDYLRDIDVSKCVWHQSRSLHIRVSSIFNLSPFITPTHSTFLPSHLSIYLFFLHRWRSCSFTHKPLSSYFLPSP